MKITKQFLEKLRKDIFEYVIDGHYDQELSYWTNDNREPNTEDKRMEAFNRFDRKVNYTQELNLAFTTGQLDILHRLEREERENLSDKQSIMKRNQYNFEINLNFKKSIRANEEGEAREILEQSFYEEYGIDLTEDEYRLIEN